MSGTIHAHIFIQGVPLTVFLAMILCCVWMESSPPVDVHVEDALQQERVRGEQSAESDYQSGVVSHLGFGGKSPDDAVHRPTGLPLGSMGCEPDEQGEAYAQGYNSRMASLIEDNPPLPEGMTITWTHQPAVSHRRAGPQACPVGDDHHSADGVC